MKDKILNGVVVIILCQGAFVTLCMVAVSMYALSVSVGWLGWN